MSKVGNGEFQPRDVPEFLVDLSPLNSRAFMSDAKFKALVESVRVGGIITPLILRIVGDRFEVAAGERRLRAAREVGLQYVPARVKEMTDDEFFRVMVEENDQREDVSDLDRARSYQAWLDRGTSADEIAATLKRSRSFVYQCIQLLKLVEPLQKMLLAGEITPGHAVELARLTPADQEFVLAPKKGRGGKVSDLFECDWDGRRYVKGEVINVRALRALIHRQCHLEMARVPWNTADPDLVKNAGPCTACPKRTSVNADLFGEDLAKQDLCTDRACFGLKRTRTAERKLAEIKAKGEAAVLISDEDGYSGNDTKRLAAAGILEQVHPSAINVRDDGGYRLAGTQRCEHLAKGVVADGREIGATKLVCTKPKTCKVHGERKPAKSRSSSSHAAAPKSSAAARAAEKAKEEQRVLDARRRLEVKRRALVGVLDYVKKHGVKAFANRDLVQALAFQARTCSEGSNCGDEIADERFGSLGYGGGALKNLAKLTLLQLLEVLVLALFAGELQEYGPPSSALCFEAAVKTAGVDTKAIDAAVAKEQAVEAVEAAEAAKAAAPKADAKKPAAAKKGATGKKGKKR